MNWILWITETGQGRKKVVLLDGVVVRLGRRSDCDICVKSPKVSRQQLSLCPMHEGVKLAVDEQASVRPNIDGHPVEPGASVLLRNGATVRISDVLLELDSAPDNLRDSEEEHDAEDDETPSMSGLHPQDNGQLPVLNRKTETSFEHQADEAFSRRPPTETLGSLTGATRAQDAAINVTRAVQERSEDADSRDAGGDLTGFLPEHEARRVIKQNAARPRKNLLIWCSVTVAALIGLLWLRKPDDGPKTIRHEGTFFSIAYPDSWVIDSAAQTIVFSRTGARHSGVAVLRSRDERIWKYDYEDAFRDALDRWGAAVEGVDRIQWEAWDTNTELPLMDRVGDLGLFYVGRQGSFGNGGGALMRLFLSRDQYVMLATWSVGRPLAREFHEVMGSFEINQNEVPLDFVCRDIRWRNVDFDFSAIDELLQEAVYLFKNRHAALGNAWRAKVKAMDVLRLYAIGGHREPARIDAKYIWENHLLEYARYIEDEYRRRMTDMIAALSAGDSARIRRLADEIQTLIPEKQDPRWVWAQRESLEARRLSSRRRGFF